MSRASTILGILVTVVVTLGTSAEAQVAITNSPPSGRFPAGPDYATDVLGDPWDFTNPEDISPDPDMVQGWTKDAQARSAGTGVFLNGGRFTATSSNNDPALTVLDRGALNIINTGRTGLSLPIDASRYRKIAVRVSGTSSPVVYWFHRPDWHPQSGSAIGFKVLPAAAGPGWQTLIADLGTSGSGASWTGFEGLVRGLRFDPIAQAGLDVQIDWIRLTAGDGDSRAAIMTGTVACGGAWTLDVVDNDSVDTIVTGSGSGSWSFNYGVFPPGAYGLRLTCNGAAVNTLSFTIDAPPTISVLSPSKVGGEDFASSPQFAQSGTSGAWDMEQPGDIDALYNVSGAAAAAAPSGGNELVGTSTSSDPQVVLFGNTNNQLPIPTSRYDRLTFTLTIDGEYSLGQGSVARVVWNTSQWQANDANVVSKDIKVYPGRHTYTVDVSALSSVPDPLSGATLESCSGCSVLPWATKGVWYLRIDPHEFSMPRTFRLDNVALRADDEAPIGGLPFTIRWQVADSDASPGQHSVKVFWDDDLVPDTTFGSGSSPKLIASRTALVNVQDSVSWSPAGGMAPGQYFIYVQVTDAATGAVRGSYSTAPVRVFTPASPPVITMSRPSAGSIAFAPMTIEGCAGESSAGSVSGVDEVAVYAVGGSDVGIVPQRGSRYPLGLLPNQPGLGLLSTNLACPGAAGPGTAANGGFHVTGVGDLSPGSWTLRVLARGVSSGIYGVLDIPFTIDWRSPPARNLRLISVSGGSVGIAWDPPDGGRAVTAYRIEVATTPTFSPLAAMLSVPPQVTGGSGVLPNGTWYVRVISESAYSTNGVPSNVLAFTLPGGGTPGPPTPPGAPVLQVVQGQANPVTLAWSPGSGGPPSQYVLHAGSAPGASNFGVFDLSGQSGITAMAPVGVPVYVRLVASNASGSATSNEVSLFVGGGTPAVPALHPATVAGNNVTLSWSAAAGATSYTVLARAPGSPAIIATLPGQLSTGAFVPNVPPGVYVVTVVSVNAAGHSAESNAIQVVVP